VSLCSTPLLILRGFWKGSRSFADVSFIFRVETGIIWPPFQLVGDFYVLASILKLEKREFIWSESKEMKFITTIFTLNETKIDFDSKIMARKGYAKNMDFLIETSLQI
jgi:hypothetical protein